MNDKFKIREGMIDAVLDTDAYNEIDDQFAIAYMLRSSDKINTKALYAAPFYNRNSSGAADGMEKSYDEIFKVLSLCGREDLFPNVYKGSTSYLSDEQTPVISDAAHDLAKRAMDYTPENPLYVVAIGAITNVASALLINPEIKDRIVVVWLGGHSLEINEVNEFNMVQDIAAARVVMGCGVPFVQLPCCGVVSEFRISKPELEYWLIGKNSLADYLARNTINAAEFHHRGETWTRVIWDVTAVAWLVNDNERFLRCRVINTRLPSYDKSVGYEPVPIDHEMCYTYFIKRDALMQDLFEKILERKIGPDA